MTFVEYRRGSSPEALSREWTGVADAVIADPPYGGNKRGGRQDAGDSVERHRIANDRDLSVFRDTAPTIARLLSPRGVALIFGSPEPELRREMIDIIEGAGLVLEGTTAWDKLAMGMGYRVRWEFEDVHIAHKQGHDVFGERSPLPSLWRVPRIVGCEHPNEKPVGLYRQMLRWARADGGTVVDPFAGIASCGVAAVAEGWSYIGVECDARWWPIAERRLADAKHEPHPAIPQASLFSDGAA